MRAQTNERDRNGASAAGSSSTHSWMNRFHRILARWEKRASTYLAMLHPGTYLAMLHLVYGLITWRATNWGRQAE